MLVGWALTLSPAAHAIDLTVDSGAANECEAVPGARAAAVAYLEPAPVLSTGDYGGNHYAPSSGNNLGVGVGFGEIGAGVAHFCVGLLVRAEFEGIASKDLLDIVHDNYFGKTFDVGRTYKAYYDAQTLKAEGARLRRAFELPDFATFHFTLGLGASLLRATQGRQDFLSGSATGTSPSYAVGTATWLRTDSDLNPADFNPFVGPGHPTGLGFSTDFELKAVSSGGATLDVIIMDAVGRIYWRGTRNSLRVLDNATIRYNADFNEEAFITGQDSRIDETEHIPTKYHVAFSQPVLGELSALLEDDAIDGYHFVSVGARYGTLQRSVATTFDTRVHAVGISARWLRFYASFTTNRWLPREATALGASIGITTLW